jgi:hypothetical protein
VTTDAQAALAAAALIMAATRRGPSVTSEQDTLNMADGFLRWLQRPGHTTIERHADGRLIPNEDFRSPSAARTERINPNDVTFAAAELERAAANQATALLDTSWRYTGPHVPGGPACVTPSGANACLCGEKWPCSQSSAAKRLRGETMP